jgi:transposase InsO family protein
LEWDCPEHALLVQADLLTLNRSSLYYKPVPPSPEEIHLKHRIDELYTQYPFMGYRTVSTIMNREGDSIHKNTVRHYMREMGLMAVYPGPNLSKRDLQHRTYPYLLRGLQILHPNQVWSVDITYIRMKQGWMYLFGACLLFLEDKRQTFFPDVFNIGGVPTYRNNGLASNMLKRALTFLKADYPILRISVLQGTYAESLYYNLGFMPAEVEVERFILPSSEVKLLQSTQ